MTYLLLSDWSPPPEEKGRENELRGREGEVVEILPSNTDHGGWAYAASVWRPMQAGEKGAQRIGGWVPRSLLRMVDLHHVTRDYEARGTGQLSVKKGDWIALGDESDNGWVHGQRFVWRADETSKDRYPAGWLPKTSVSS